MGNAAYYSYLAVTDSALYWFLAYNFLWSAVVSLSSDITRLRDNESYPVYFIKNAFIPLLIARSNKFQRLQKQLNDMLDDDSFSAREIDEIGTALVYGNVGQMQTAINKAYRMRYQREGATNVEA
ncbi:hypothetical protein [Photobacterium halotolerans]|uniref:hypothetical protein n=1 Tax=Photobacterium halotolerans TaxID=265726 RepID=UPI000486167D|nr:hypothetical protein [Photobacterium halotolerans]